MIFGPKSTNVGIRRNKGNSAKNLDEQIGAQVNAQVRSFNLMKQAQMLTKDTPDLLARYEGKVVVYYNHSVLASGDNEDEVVKGLTAEQTRLPIIIRRLTRKEDYMGGPK